MITLSPGGFLKSVEDDSSPQLSGDLDGQSTHSLVNMVDGTFSGVGTFGSLDVAHADTHAFGDSDPVDHDLLANWDGKHHIDWTSTDDDLLTTGSGTFGALVVDTNTLVVDAVNNRVGIGTTTPIVQLHASDGNALSASLLGAGDMISMSRYNAPVGFSGYVAGDDGGDRAVYKGVRARGTLANPTVPLEDDDVLTFLATIWDGNSPEATAGVFFKVDGTVSDEVAPQRISFVTSATRAEVRAERMVIRANGDIETYRNVRLMLDTLGFQLTSNSGSVRYGLKYGNAGSVGGSDNLALTNREDDGDLRFQTSPGGGAGNEVDRLVIDGATGNVGVGTTTPTAKLDISSDKLRLRTAKTPASAGAAGDQGDICWDASYIYACVAASTWKRAALATW